LTALCPRTVQIAAVLGLLASTAVWADEPVEVRVSSSFVLEGANVVITVRIAPDEGNRFLTIQADSLDYYRSSRIQLSGAKAPALHTMQLQSLPSGSYEIRAILTRIDDDVEQSAPMRLRVIDAH
jgi:hypothetical protein